MIEQRKVQGEGEGGEKEKKQLKGVMRKESKRSEQKEKCKCDGRMVMRLS